MVPLDVYNLSHLYTLESGIASANIVIVAGESDWLNEAIGSNESTGMRTDDQSTSPSITTR